MRELSVVLDKFRKLLCYDGYNYTPFFLDIGAISIGESGEEIVTKTLCFLQIDYSVCLLN
ncbi:hypothetical protein CYANOKiyG1_32550 [Okeania sp. KiyG1]|nr:hypothetical protein CYANOKiyG1_32550 [Okeania sp. KiyG1]